MGYWFGEGKGEFQGLKYCWRDYLEEGMWERGFGEGKREVRD